MRNLPSTLVVLALGLSLTACPEDRIEDRFPDLSVADAGGGDEADAGEALEADAGALCEGETVATAGGCLQDDAFCFELPDGRWCTGPAAPICPSQSHPVAFDAPCQEGHRCWEFSPSLRCESDEPSTDVARCESCSLEQQIPLLAASDAEACGTLSLAATSDDATQCIAAALESGRPFTAIAMLQGIDSIVRIAWVTDESGRLSLLHYDSSICGGSGCSTPGCGPRVERSICTGPRVSADAEYTIECDEMGPLQTLCGPDSR